jgi:hypothetical protein
MKTSDDDFLEPVPIRRAIEAANLQPTEIGFTLDQSYSMIKYRNAAVAGVREIILEQRRANPEARFTFTTFSDGVKVRHDREMVRDIVPITELEPDGSTPLLDGIGDLMERIGQRYDSLVLKPRVLITVLTDGLENSSERYTLRQVLDTITRRRLQDHWEFVFFCPTREATDYAISLGFKQIVLFDTDVESFVLLLRGISKSLQAFTQGRLDYTRHLYLTNGGGHDLQ